jgi:hypothetical protein
MAIDFQAARDPVCDGVEVLEAAVADTNSLWMFQVKEAGCKPALPGTWPNGTALRPFTSNAQIINHSYSMASFSATCLIPCHSGPQKRVLIVSGAADANPDSLQKKLLFLNPKNKIGRNHH